MKKANLYLLLAILTTVSACNRDSSRSRRAAKPVVADHTVKISEADFDRLVVQSFQPMLVEFWHENTEDCQKMDPTLEELAVEFEGRLKVGKVHIGQSPKLAEFYGIRAIPVTILFNGNTEVDRYVGLKSKDEIAARLNKLLPPKK